MEADGAMLPARPILGVSGVRTLTDAIHAAASALHSRREWLRQFDFARTARAVVDV